MGEHAMHRTRLALSISAIAAVIAMSGCDPKPSTEASPTSPAPAASSSASADVTTDKTTDTTAADPTTVKACADVKKDIKDNAAKVAKAEKIGPPAGYIAVSAQWAAGSTAVIAHSIGANATVSAAADKVQNEMMALSDASNKSGNSKPSQKKLEVAIRNLTIACSAT